MPSEESPLRPSLAKPCRVDVRIRQSAPALLIMVFVSGFLLLLCALLAGALLYVSAASRGDGDAEAEKVFHERLVAGDPRERTKVLLVEIDGVIVNDAEEGLLSGRMGLVDRIDRMLRQAEDDASVKAVLLRVNSPGGGITATDILYRRLVEHRERTGAKVVALLGDMATSGGYYVAMAADQVIAHPTTVTGSIGVIMPLMGLQELLGKIGIEPRPIKSADKKDIGSFYRDMTEEERGILRGIVDEMYNRFLAVAEDGAARRGSADLTPGRLRELADGRIVTGESAAANGLVNKTGYFADALAEARSLADAPSAKLVRYAPKPRGLLDVLRGPSVQKPGEITLRLEAPAWMRASGPMYLWCPGAPTLMTSADGRSE